MKKVIIASTSLHLTDSLILKKQFKDEYYLVYIGKENSFFNLIKESFAGYLYLKEKKDKNKIPLRIQNSKVLIEYIKSLNPDEIIVGNDRKTETSVLIANYNAFYSYMDDGLHSYIPEKQHIFKYTPFEKKLKEIIYKNSLVLPKYIGGGEYIKKAYLYRPDLANSYLKTKELVRLVPDIEYLNQFFEKFVDGAWKKKLQNAEKIIFLPHPKFITEKIIKKLVTLINSKTLLKLHPRDNKTEINAEIVPNEIFSEAVFGFLNRECKIYGYKTTAILTGKWIREELDVYNLCFDNKNERVMEENGIKGITL